MFEERDSVEKVKRLGKRARRRVDPRKRAREEREKYRQSRTQKIAELHS